MAKSYVSMFFNEFKDKFNTHSLHTKKVRALQRYNSVVSFKGESYVPLLAHILKDGFLDQEEDRFLDHLINKLKLDALGWAYKTPWIKAEMARLKAKKEAKPVAQLQLPLEPKKVFVPKTGYPLVRNFNRRGLRA